MRYAFAIFFILSLSFSSSGQRAKIAVEGFNVPIKRFTDSLTYQIITCADVDSINKKVMARGFVHDLFEEKKFGLLCLYIHRKFTFNDFYLKEVWKEGTDYTLRMALKQEENEAEVELRLTFIDELLYGMELLEGEWEKWAY